MEYYSRQVYPLNYDEDNYEEAIDNQDHFLSTNEIRSTVILTEPNPKYDFNDKILFVTDKLIEERQGKNPSPRKIEIVCYTGLITRVKYSKHRDKKVNDETWEIHVQYYYTNRKNKKRKQTKIVPITEILGKIEELKETFIHLDSIPILYPYLDQNKVDKIITEKQIQFNEENRQYKLQFEIRKPLPKEINNISIVDLKYLFFNIIEKVTTDEKEISILEYLKLALQTDNLKSYVKDDLEFLISLFNKMKGSEKVFLHFTKGVESLIREEKSYNDDDEEEYDDEEYDDEEYNTHRNPKKNKKRYEDDENWEDE